MIASIRKKIFGTFDPIEKIEWDEFDRPLQQDEIYSGHDPYDHYHNLPGNTYRPKTLAAMRLAFSQGVTDIENYIQMAASLRALSDEVRDLDELTRLFSLQKLSLRADPLSVMILRGMIKDVNPEIALYAAEGLNTITTSYNDKIQNLRNKLDEASAAKDGILHDLARLYLDYSRLWIGQDLIKVFYLDEAMTAILSASGIKPDNMDYRFTYGEILMDLARFEEAIVVFSIIMDSTNEPLKPLLKISECYYSLKKYDEVYKTISRITQLNLDLEPEDELVIYQWIM